MAIQFNCPSCGLALSVAEAHAGKGMICKGCAARVTVPQAAAATPYGSAAPRSPLMTRKPNLIFIGAALLMMIAMGMPWLNIPGEVPEESRAALAGYTSGFGLPFLMNRTAGEMVAYMDSPANRGDVTPEAREQVNAMATTFKILYVLYLIPLLAMVCLVDEALSARKGRNRWWLRVLNTASPVVAFVVIFAAFTALVALIGEPASAEQPEHAGPTPYSPFSFIGIGVYALGVAMLLSLISIFLSPKPVEDVSHTVFTPRGPRKAPTRQTDKVRRPTSKVAVRPVSLPATSVHPPDKKSPSVRLPRKSGRLKPPTST